MFYGKIYNVFIFIISKSVYVIYGSQTGNAESLAKDFASKLLDDGLPVVCEKLNDVKKFPFKEKAICIVLVCSTTGNADCPENADAWWRSVKLRSLVSVNIWWIVYS